MASVKIIAKLEQLSCPDCANMIGNVVSRIKGVEEAEVRYTTSKLLVSYDESKTSWDTIQNSVAKLGYKVLSHTQRGE
jgi:copper chaperone CopZ